MGTWCVRHSRQTNKLWIFLRTFDKILSGFRDKSQQEWRVPLFQSNLREQIKKLPKCLKFVKINIIKLFNIIQYHSFVSLVRSRAQPAERDFVGRHLLRQPGDLSGASLGAIDPDGEGRPLTKLLRNSIHKKKDKTTQCVEKKNTLRKYSTCNVYGTSIRTYKT